MFYDKQMDSKEEKKKGEEEGSEYNRRYLFMSSYLVANRVYLGLAPS
jgi:hypothetical protein